MACPLIASYASLPLFCFWSKNRTGRFKTLWQNMLSVTCLLHGKIKSKPYVEKFGFRLYIRAWHCPVINIYCESGNTCASTISVMYWPGLGTKNCKNGADCQKGTTIDIVDCWGNGSFPGQWCLHHGGRHFPCCDAILNETERERVQSSPQFDLWPAMGKHTLTLFRSSVETNDQWTVGGRFGKAFERSTKRLERLG